MSVPTPALSQHSQGAARHGPSLSRCCMGHSGLELQCLDVAQGAQMLLQDTEISPGMPRCCLGVPQCCFRMLRYNPGCPDIAPEYSDITWDFQMLPQGAQMLPPATLLSPPASPPSDAGSHSCWQRCCPGPEGHHHLRSWFPLPVLRLLVPMARTGLEWPLRPLQAPWIFARSCVGQSKPTLCHKDTALCPDMGLKSKPGSASALSLITLAGLQGQGPRGRGRGSSPTATHLFPPHLPSASGGVM